ncbi:DUF1998 domain-containing protein [Nocardia sp. SYP-A9097]|uniref:DUF1998 domain-containing protein n=1 Tax=Nocardia sp. SYP-A9097 TaxID=2663237 RepID=UPI00129B065F|nr:DUF1998 domain-containing protein [Nocardia sp. SYP-A9097]MRH92823.1 DUF1998 domain-containing protein [Nocardia sp. SYP-A9097]
MADNFEYFRRVGSVRPSHLMFTTGVGALVDLPNFAVLVKGLDDWDLRKTPQMPIVEPRVLDAVQRILGKGVKDLQPAPWLEGMDSDPKGPASTVGVPVTPFPGWFRCTYCNLLAPLSGHAFEFQNINARRPHEARFVHAKCAKKGTARPLAVTARFVLSCTNGHLDEFPYREFVHQGASCPQVAYPRLQMEDRGGNLGADVKITCLNCSAERNIRDAMGARGQENLPPCRARHPHLAIFEPRGCVKEPKVIVVGASNQWFAETLSGLAVPPLAGSVLDALVEKHWAALEPLQPAMYPYGRSQVPAFKELLDWTDEQIAQAVERHRAELVGAVAEESDDSGVDLKEAEWQVFSGEQLPDPNSDFALYRDVDGVPKPLSGIYDDVIQAERLREVRALIGFTRLDAPDPEDRKLVPMAPMSRGKSDWIPASEVRGEGLFFKLPEDLLRDWEQRVQGSEAMARHQEAYGFYRRDRYSDRIVGPFDPMANWPGMRFYALHTLSHLLIRTIALECGYGSASLSERIYSADSDDGPRSGILIYTAVPDSEGTLGGLVSLAEPDQLVRLTRRALQDARNCSSDPLCAERLPIKDSDILHGAACHICLFVSETTCERGNKFLDRRFVVPLGDHPELALFPDLP